MADDPVVSRPNNALRFKHDDLPVAPAKRKSFDTEDASFLQRPKPNVSLAPVTAKPSFFSSGRQAPNVPDKALTAHPEVGSQANAVKDQKATVAKPTGAVATTLTDRLSK